MIEKGICMADGKTGAIILAAGRSAHMEELKPMLRMGQTTMIQREIDTIRQAGISPIVVGTGNVIFHTVVRSVSETSGMRHRRCTAQSAWDCAISRKKPIGCCCSLPTCR